MRAPRAYLAGFGTTGSLLAGAALLFLLASAFVGFHGWPQVGEAPSPAAVSLSGAGAQAGSPAARALGTASAPAAGHSVSGGARLTSHGRTHGAGGAAAGQLRRASGHTSVGPAIPHGSTSGPTGNPTPSPQSCSGSGCSQTPGAGPGSITGPVKQVVSTAGSALNTAVTTVTKHLPGGVGSTVVKKGSGAVSSTLSKVTHKLPSTGSSAGLP